MEVHIKLPLSYRNKNYVGSIFGGSLFSAVDPIYMVQLINILGDEYIVWDRSAEIFFKRPAKETAFGFFQYDQEEIEKIKADVKEKGEIELKKTTLLTDLSKTNVFCEIIKTIYVADKSFYFEKRKKKTERTNF